MLVYRRGYNSNHLLLKLTEGREKSLNQKTNVGTVIKDLSKAFDAITHNLLIANYKNKQYS